MRVTRTAFAVSDLEDVLPKILTPLPPSPHVLAVLRMSDVGVVIDTQQQMKNGKLRLNLRYVMEEPESEGTFL